MPILSQIHVYPVKSLAGFSVERWPVDKNGLQYDRKWMLVDEQGQFLSQRRFPKMALIKTRIEAGLLWLAAPGRPEVSLPLNGETVAENPAEDVPVRIWEDDCLAQAVNPALDAWLSDFLGTFCRLVYHPDHRVRKVDPRFALDSDQTAYSDGFPFLLVSEASLQAINSVLSVPVTMQRFRPNLVVAACTSYAEDSWRQIRINQIGFRLPKPCSRCAIPGIDPETAIADKELLSTLAKLRKWEKKIYFGQNALHDSQGWLSVGDVVQIDVSAENQPPL